LVKAAGKPEEQVVVPTRGVGGFACSDAGRKKSEKEE
jgi:hypothetical protein